MTAHILVVEDEYLVALDIRLSVERLGYDAVVAYTGEEALQRVAERSFDLVLMDIRLRGDLDGIDTARALSERQDVPLMFLTPYSDAPTLERARATETYGYFL